jgi:hypothetical protein
MIYQFVQYLKNNFPAETIYTNYELANSPDRILLVKESGGPIVPRVLFASPVIQIIARDIDTTGARVLSYDIYDLINDVYGLVLPAVTVDGETYASIQLAQISANQSPYPFGVDEQGRYVFLNNYRIHYTEA